MKTRQAKHTQSSLFQPLRYILGGLLFTFITALPVEAQVKFGYISYTEVVKQMPQYATAQEQLADLKKKYDAEATRSEDEFQRKFADFLQGQKDFPANILQKRQAELQEIMERGIAFRKEAEELLRQAEKDLLQDVYNQLNAAITSVGIEQGCAFVLNTDGNACPYIDPNMGENLTDYVRVRLGILKQLPITEEQRKAEESNAEGDNGQTETSTGNEEGNCDQSETVQNGDSTQNDTIHNDDAGQQDGQTESKNGEAQTGNAQEGNAQGGNTAE